MRPKEVQEQLDLMNKEAETTEPAKKRSKYIVLLVRGNIARYCSLFA